MYRGVDIVREPLSGIGIRIARNPHIPLVEQSVTLLLKGLVMKTLPAFHFYLLTGCLLLASSVQAQQPTENSSSLQATLDGSAEAGKFTFIVFYREDSNSTRTMYQLATDGAAARSTQAVATAAQVDDPAEQALVERFGISRAPMPMTVVVAPNGAVTGLFARTITDEQLDVAIVTPTMMQCMKDLQDQKLVFVCLTRTEECEVPPGVQALSQDPLFSERVSLIALRIDDPNEARMFEQLQVDARQVNGPLSALIAPPGVLVGHYDARATVEEIAASIHAAGKCCDDPNCRHNRMP